MIVIDTYERTSMPHHQSSFNHVSITDAVYSKSRPALHCRVLPPGEFNSIMPQPLSVYSECFITVLVTILCLLHADWQAEAYRSSVFNMSVRSSVRPSVTSRAEDRTFPVVVWRLGDRDCTAQYNCCLPSTTDCRRFYCFVFLFFYFFLFNFIRCPCNVFDVIVSP